MIDSPRTRESLIVRLPTTGDAEAWQEFSAIYEPLIYRFARGRGLQDADARELVQNVFVSVAQAVSGWKPDAERGRFRAWLFRIARNHLINLIRRRRPDCGSGRTSEILRLQQVSSDDELEAELEIQHRRELFRSAASFVREQVQESTWNAFWLTAIEGVSIEAASEQLEMSSGAIYIARSRILHRMRELIQSWEDADG